MAGTPQRTLFRPIMARAKQQGLSGPNFVYDWIASGKTVSDLAAEIGVSRSYLSRHINAVPEYAQAIEAARRESADAMVESGLKMLDDVSELVQNSEMSRPSDWIAAVDKQVQHRKFMAAAHAPERWATKDRAAVTVNIGDLHLEALRQQKAMRDVTPGAVTHE